MKMLKTIWRLRDQGKLLEHNPTRQAALSPHILYLSLVILLTGCGATIEVRPEQVPGRTTRNHPGPGHPVPVYPVTVYPGPVYPGSVYPGSVYPGSVYPGRFIRLRLVIRAIIRVIIRVIATIQHAVQALVSRLRQLAEVDRHRIFRSQRAIPP